MTVIYQVTDTHVPVEDKPSKKNFRLLMEYVNENPVELLTITGDLPSRDGDAEAYRWMKQQLPVNQRTVIIPGNHDDDDVLYEVFGRERCVNPDFVHMIPLDEIDVFFTNTGSGQFPEDQLEGLNDARPDSILFTHYPTRAISDGFMDRTYPLADVAAVDRAIAATPIRHVFCGHFHAAHTSQGSYDLHVTPSPAFEIELNEAEIKLSPGRIPLRKITIEGRLTSSEIIYLDDAPAHRDVSD